MADSRLHDWSSGRASPRGMNNHDPQFLWLDTVIHEPAPADHEVSHLAVDSTSPLRVHLGELTDQLQALEDLLSLSLRQTSRDAKSAVGPTNPPHRRRPFQIGRAH